MLNDSHVVLRSTSSTWCGRTAPVIRSGLGGLFEQLVAQRPAPAAARAGRWQHGGGRESHATPSGTNIAVWNRRALLRRTAGTSRFARDSVDDREHDRGADWTSVLSPAASPCSLLLGRYARPRLGLAGP